MSIHTPHPTRVVLSASARRQFLALTIHGQGGFQSFCRSLQDRLRRSPSLVLTQEEFQRIVRYATAYGEGGFQHRLRTLLAVWVAQHLDLLQRAA